MKKLLIALTLGALLLSLTLTVAPAYAAPQFEDPLLCVNGKLLMVGHIPAADIFVSVPAGTHLSDDVAACGGDPTLGIIPLSNVSYDGKAGVLQVTVKNAAQSPTLAEYNGKSQIKTSNSKGIAVFKFQLD